MPILENTIAVFQMAFPLVPFLVWPCRAIAIVVAVPYVILSVRLSRLGGDVHALNKSWFHWHKDVVARKSFYFSMNGSSVGSLFAYEVIETFLSCALVVLSINLSEQLFSFALAGVGAVMLAVSREYDTVQRHSTRTDRPTPPPFLPPPLLPPSSHLLPPSLPPSQEQRDSHRPKDHCQVGRLAVELGHRLHPRTERLHVGVESPQLLAQPRVLRVL